MVGHSCNGKIIHWSKRHPYGWAIVNKSFSLLLDKLDDGGEMEMLLASATGSLSPTSQPKH